MKACDLVIVGAGFAGLACAEAAARHNLRTLVLERKHDPGGHIQTTGILVPEIVEDWIVPARLLRRISGVRLYSPSLEWIDLSSPGYSFFATDTPELMRWQMQQAEAAGARILLETPYSSSRYVNDRHYMEQPEMCCRFLVGCDGARSRVARQYRLGRNRRFLIGVEAIYPGLAALDHDRFHVFLDGELAPGYIGWVVPGVNCTQVGLAARFPVAPRLQEFLRRIAPVIDLRSVDPVSHRAGVIPCGGPVANRSEENVLLLGDAAGMASPLTGGGIHAAVSSGRAAGRAIAYYLEGDGAHPAAILRAAIPGMRCKQALRALYDHIPMPAGLADALLHRPWFRALAQMVFFHHRGLLSTAAWRDVLRIMTSLR